MSYTLLPTRTFTYFAPFSDALKYPSGVIPTHSPSLNPTNMAISFPVCISHSLRVLSSLPDNAVFPSGEKETEETPLLCPLKVRIFFPVFISQRLRLAPLLPDNAYFPSGEKETE